MACFIYRNHRRRNVRTTQWFGRACSYRVIIWSRIDEEKCINVDGRMMISNLKKMTWRYSAFMDPLYTLSYNQLIRTIIIVSMLNLFEWFELHEILHNSPTYTCTNASTHKLTHIHKHKHTGAAPGCLLGGGGMSRYCCASHKIWRQSPQNSRSAGGGGGGGPGNFASMFIHSG